MSKNELKCYERGLTITSEEGVEINIYEYLDPNNETGLSMIPHYFPADSFEKGVYKGSYAPANGQPFQFIHDQLGFQVRTEKCLKELGRNIPKRFIRPSSFTYFVDKAMFKGSKESYWHENCPLNPLVKSGATKNTAIGTAFHKLVEVDGDLDKLAHEGVVAYQPVDSKDWGYDVVNPSRTTKKYQDAYAKTKESFPDKDVILLSPLEMDLVRNNYNKYREYLAGVLSGYEIVGREVRFDVDNFLGTGFGLGGTIDIIAKNRETGRYTIIDIKTSTDADIIKSFEKMGSSAWDSSKIYQVLAYAYLAHLHYKLPFEEFDIMFLPVLISDSTKVCNPVRFRLDSPSVNKQNESFKTCFETMFRSMAEFLEDRINKKEFLTDIKELNNFNLPYISTFTYEQDSIHLENLVKALGITIEKRHIHEVNHKNKQYKVYKIELYREIAQKLGYSVCLYEILKNGTPPRVYTENGKIKVIIDQSSHEDFYKGENQENKFSYVFCYVLNSEGGVMSYDSYDRFDLQKMDDFAISDSFKTNSAWKVYAKQMQYKAATKLILNKTFRDGGVYKDLYSNEIFQLLDRITNQQYKEIMG
jgi:hypothetical protein